ncbi:hypothetical protein CHU93_15245 [Sandarakinorhabdus cyanobacteriorum]|uniref:Uncharacterized protein n=1 Tax=Sandarakinorhabdus cyanobacteriorum TaxID=1981098 RepID=A0A255Y7K1_9SPHN|nr:hypothetical protein [Sandarakinorhabdus cyanobacteriorum]OYQ24714.1 hypothetical protein CHU93_15245 [Sandarakinorhabdus cyanobacteriorum]
MTALSTQTALDIIASHGADPARWPADQRAALLALAASDAAVAAALADARAIDAALTDWLNAPLPAMAVDVAAITAQPQQMPQQMPHAPATRRWMPAAVAASLALVVAVGGWLGLQPQSGNGAPTIAAATPPSAGVEQAEADAAFAYVFTPTAAEEELI